MKKLTKLQGEFCNIKMRCKSKYLINVKDYKDVYKIKDIKSVKIPSEIAQSFQVLVSFVKINTNTYTPYKCAIKGDTPYTYPFIATDFKTACHGTLYGKLDAMKVSSDAELKPVLTRIKKSYETWTVGEINKLTEEISEKFLEFANNVKWDERKNYDWVSPKWKPTQNVDTTFTPSFIVNPINPVIHAQQQRLYLSVTTNDTVVPNRQITLCNHTLYTAVCDQCRRR